MKAFLDSVYDLPIYCDVVEQLNKDSGCTMISGCVDADKAHLLYGLVRGIKKPAGRTILVVTYSEIKAKSLVEDYRFYSKNVFYYPAKDYIFYNADVHSNYIIEQRLSAIKALVAQKNSKSDTDLVIVTTIDGLGDMLVPLSRITDYAFSIGEGDTIDLDNLPEKLIAAGYVRSLQVEESGQFAIRGGIIDIYPFTGDCPVRIELWDDEVDSIRTFDVSSQRSIERIEQIYIFPATQTPFAREEIEDGIIAIKEELDKIVKVYEKQKMLTEAGRIKKIVNEAIEYLSEVGDSNNDQIGKFLRYICKNTVTFLDYFDYETLVVLDEPDQISGRMDGVTAEFAESMKNRLEKGYILRAQADVMLSEKEIMAKLAARKVLCVSALSYKPRYLFVDNEYKMNARSIFSYNNKFEMLVDDIKKYRKKNYKIILVCNSRTRAERISIDLRDYDIPAVYNPDVDKSIEPSQVLVMYGQLRSGFEYPDDRFVCIAESDIFGARTEKKRKRKNYEGKSIATFSELVPGDYVVHEKYGLGVYRGIEKLKLEGTEKDYMKIEYGGGSELHVLATQLDSIQKYAASDAKAPKLSKLGSSEWNKTKSKVQGAVSEIAKDLVELYATRQMREGFVYGPDTTWQKEFEEMFPYEETDDQINAINDTKADMESSKIMDRLICGDVGFGKTEIAIRAAFKAVQDGKQVVYLCPTTILAGQHYDTFVERMKDFPVKVELLSRFRSTKQIKTAIEGLKKGMVDIVIGTHRVLSADVEFKNLGLLIIDEEQRFGVAHKEKIKKLRENVDVLTLSATPIPRTLHMSLVGIRDMSVLEEPPHERLPIQTFVTEYNEEMIREAINRELNRNGQVYYVYNKVASIDEMAAKVASLVPTARVAYAHGQMDERTLERVMYDFINGEIDVLVSTTIIETGLDISNVNTMIIHDADQFGLSQLYQLRGRIGRSNRTSYAFLLYKRDKMIKEVAQKRLEAIKEFSDLGSGFKIAMKDLEIRGAGNVLGAKQSGHMAAVGYDLYCKMLNEAVKTLKGESETKDFDTVVDLTMDAFIPATYIKNEIQKLDIYKRIATIETREEVLDMEDELVDRFGDLPRSATNLLDIALLKSKAHESYFTEIKGGKNGVRLTLAPDAKINYDIIPDMVEKYKGFLKFKIEPVAGSKQYFTYLPENKFVGADGDREFLAQLMEIVDEVRG